MSGKSSSTQCKPAWKWTNKDLGVALVRYRCDDSNAPRHTIPANFIRNFNKGDKIDGKYLYKVFWSRDKDRDTPIKYLKTADKVPNFEVDTPDASFGEPGCYRATVYTVQNDLKALENWRTKTGRLKDVPSKLCYASFDSPSASPKSQETNNKNIGSSLDKKEGLKPDQVTKPGRNNQSIQSAKRDGARNNLSSLRDKLREEQKEKGTKSVQIEDAKSRIETHKRSGAAKRKSTHSESSSDDSTDLLITSPRKVRAMEAQLALQRQELRKAALVKERLRAQIKELELASENKELERVAEDPINKGSNSLQATQANDENNVASTDEKHGFSTGEVAGYGCSDEESTAIIGPTLDDLSGKASTSKNETVKSKKQQKREERDNKRKQITTLVPIPQDFKYKAEEFRVSDVYFISAEDMGLLWSKAPGIKGDPVFVKTAAVMMFGSATLLKVGVVRGITKGGCTRKGLDPTALEGIRVLLILRVQREGEEVVWHTERTKQACVTAFITDKIKALKAAHGIALANKAAKESDKE